MVHSPGRWAGVWLPLFALLIYTPFLFLGFGSDLDIYQSLDAGRRLLEGEGYRPSRNPGYLLYEVTSASLAGLGGAVLSNLASALAALVALLAFRRVTRELDVPHADVLLPALALHPAFWIAATSSIDYAWALAALLLGLAALLRDRHDFAGVALGLAVGFRLASAFPAATFLVFAWVTRPSRRSGVFAAGALGALVGGALYIPSFVHAGHTLGFLQPHTGPADLWTARGHVGRFVFKNVCLFWGVPACLLLLALALPTLRGLRAGWRGARRHTLALSLAVVAVVELLYLRFPLEPAYLLPALPFALMALAIAWEARRGWLVAFSVLVVSTGAVLVLLAKPDVPHEARSADVGVWLEPGTLVDDVRIRRKLAGAETTQDWLAFARAEGIR